MKARKNTLKTLSILRQLLTKSATIQLSIEDEARKRHPDWFRVITLKKQRLLIKDKIQKLRQRHRSVLA